MLLIGCLPSDPGLRGATGVRLSNGEIVVRVRVCGEPRLVSSVQVASASDVDVVLWRIESQAGSLRDEFTVGETPTDFEQTTTLSEALRPGTNYYATAIEPNRALTLPGVTFDPAELASDVWLTSKGRKLSDEEFRRLDPC
jgi:hypothetical protein